MRTLHLDPEIKKQWLEALRSGQYKQGRGYLRKIDEDGDEVFCCLGVLCDLHDKSLWSETTSESVDDPDKFWNYGPDEQDQWLPSIVAEWAFGNSSTADPCVKSPFSERYSLPLSVINDNNESSFEIIADAIEESL